MGASNNMNTAQWNGVAQKGWVWKFGEVWRVVDRE